MDERTRGLIHQRRRLLSLSPAARVEAILSAPRPAELVRSLPAADLYLTIVETGLDDALALLPLASTDQTEFFFDVDAWRRDDFDPARAARWLAAMHEADPETVVRFLREADEQLVVLLLSKILRVYKLDESSDPAFQPPDRPLSTLDGTYFVELRDDELEEAAGPLWEGLARLRERDRAAYEALLEEVMWAVPPELAETAFERRGSRLAEKGFPEFDEAMEVWAGGPESDPAERARLVERVRALPAPASAASPEEEERPAAHVPAPLAEGALPALAAAARGLPPERLERLFADVARLGNRFAVAGLEPLGEPETHRNGLRTALSMINLGLAELFGDRVAELGPRALAGLSVFELNHAGVGAVLQRVQEARRLERGWLSRVHLARRRLDAPLGETLDGLLEPRPVFADGALRRPPRTLEDLETWDETLAVAAAFGVYLEDTLRAGAAELPELDPVPARRESALDVDWSAVALTSIARLALGDGARPKPLARDEARRAIDLLADEATFARCAEELGLGAAAPYLRGVLEEDVAELPPDEPPDARFVRRLLFR